MRLVRGSTPDDVDDVLFAYLQRKLALSAGGEALELRYVGKEVELDETYVYVEVTGVPSLRRSSSAAPS